MKNNGIRSDAPIVELKAAGKTYGNIRALHGVDLTVRPGQVTCVLGDNGAGKSTLIKIMVLADADVVLGCPLGRGSQLVLYPGV